LVDEKLYKEEQTAEIFKLHPSESFVSFVNKLLLTFKRKRNQDRFLNEFYGNSHANWKEYFHPYGEQKMVFLVLIHLPERLIGFLEKGHNDQGISKVYTTDNSYTRLRFQPLGFQYLEYEPTEICTHCTVVLILDFRVLLEWKIHNLCLQYRCV
jgi:hypothetical protein